jgi:hydrogenase expression/formation protein HypC
MCLTRPALVLSITAQGQLARVRLGADETTVNSCAIPSIAVGDYVVVHAGLALERIEPQTALELDLLLAEWEALTGELPDGIATDLTHQLPEECDVSAVPAELTFPGGTDHGWLGSTPEPAGIR